MSNSNIAIYPGSFDPITNGHVDLVKRTLRVFDRVIVAIASNPDKDRSLFTVAERLRMINEVFADLGGRAEADSFQGLLVDYAERKHSKVIIRGLRAVSDFEYEFQMALMNRHLDPGLETVFMMPAEKYTYISSRLIKEVFTLGGEISGLVPPIVEKKLREKQKARKK
jgi:pantetheine-phosphate adenylyltransferase